MADAGSDGKKWALRKQFWRELDVWKYDYDHEEDRKQAIKNAIRQYDKQRLSASEPEWERLNSPEDRGKGICLSSLQSRINNKSTAPTIKVQRADESSTSKDDGEDDAKPLKSEPMSRSGSNPLSKTKKPTASEAQAKRLLSNKSKPAAPAPQKKSPTKPKAAKETNGGKQPLSQEFIENSDSSEDEPIAKSEAPRKAAPKASDSKPTAKPAAKPAERPVSKLADKTTTSATATKPKATAPPVQRPSTTATKTAPKRPLDDDDSSSSSGTPLSKRIKPKQPLPARPQAVKKRPLDSSRHVSSSGMAARDREAMANNRHKNTSPTKSSPLAASPPTNASDASDDPPPPRAVMAGKKRKADVGDSSGNRTLPPPAAKRAAHDESVPADVLSQAARFKEKYTEYEALHYEVSALANPPSSKLADLRVMRDKLARLKAQIYKKCNNV